MSTAAGDPVTDFYNRHPYPPPVANLDDYARRWSDGRLRRIEHHRLWPSRPRLEDPTVLVAGCGTSQAARYALRYPAGRVVGIDVSVTSIEQTRELARQYGLDNLELHLLSIERVAELQQTFDLVVCTGVLHHLADPQAGLRALRAVLAAHGAIQLMVYATYGRTGVAMIQEYGRRLGLDTSTDDIDDLVASLREIPLGHPLSHLLRSTPDFQDTDALADALLNPRERSYTVPEVIELVQAAGLHFGRWVRQAPYLPSCGSLTETPHGPRIGSMSIEDQYAAVELFRGTMTRHSLIAVGEDQRRNVLSFDPADCSSYVPVRPSTAISVHDRLPPGTAAALLNRAHEFTDLVLFVDDDDRSIFEAIDGVQTIAELGLDHTDFFRRLYEHDLIVVDASGSV